ncbi:MAG: hypothetical protein KGO96_10435 [Elusimicrobia bacterium]|nr:hypothetical protein [Elusimicrobiota bacterium]
MTLSTRTLRPGLLVALSTRITGNIAYERVILEEDHVTEVGTKQARWETKRVIEDPTERERARKVRSQCRGMITKLCIGSTFGLLCQEDKRSELEEAVREAQAMAAEFNSTSTLTRVGVYVIAGYIAPDDVQAVKSINSEVRGLLAEMTTGVRNLDVKQIRSAANQARQIGKMLAPEAAERIKSAVEAAREAAKKIVKAGEQAAQVIDQEALKKLAASRTMFLDMDEVEIDAALPEVSGREIDLEPELPIAAQEDQRREIEL